MADYSKENKLKKLVAFNPNEQAQADNSERLYWAGQAKNESKDIAKARKMTGENISAPSDDFDPDAYLASKETGDFDPDAYLAEKTPKKQEKRESLKTDKSSTNELIGGAFSRLLDLTPIGLNRDIVNNRQEVNAASAGLLRGAGSIGSTLLTPYDLAVGNTKSIGNPERRQAMDSGFREMGVNTESMPYKAGKVAGEIAGTAGAGGLVGNAVGRASPMLGNAISSGGFSLGGKVGGNAIANAATRLGGGAISGASMAGLSNPDDVGTGAAIGAMIPAAAKVGAMVGNGLKSSVSEAASNLLGLTTGTGSNSIKEAFNAGKSGAKSFVDNMRGNANMDDVIAQAKQALSAMRQQRADEYKQGMAAISSDKTVLDFSPIIDSVKKIQSLGSYKGQVINKNSSKTVDDIASKVDEWAALNPNEFHTPEGLDALKQAIGDIRDTTQFGTQARKAADSAYNAVKDQITKQAPTYSKTMKGYSEASKELTEIEKALSIGNKSAADTSIRKLQSLMRNNVNTNYGNRLTMAKTLEEKGGADILPAIAGQAMNSWTPRGIQGSLVGGAGGAAAFVNPSTLLALPLGSPRLVGELAYKLGAGAGGGNKLLNLITGNPALSGSKKLIASNPNLYKELMQKQSTTSQ